MKIMTLLTVCLLMPSMGMAALQPTDFAYGIPLSLKEEGAVYHLNVPMEVYQFVTRGDLEDMRVFNHTKAMVPHVLRRPAVENEIHERTTSLPFFPLYAAQNPTGRESLSVHIEKRKDGTILDIHSNGAETDSERRLVGYIFDASTHKEKIDALEISWKTPDENFVTTVFLEHSTDLTHWSTIVDRTTLARMKFKGHQIKRERVELPSDRIKYIRLSWPEDHSALLVKNIVAIQRKGKQARPHQWHTLKGHAARATGETDKKITAYEYDSNAQLPVDRVRLRFVEKNTILEAAVFSRPNPDSQWRHRRKAIFYDLSFDDTALVQNTVTVQQTSDRYWRLEIAKDSLGDAQNIPTMELAWLPHKLIFAARGDGPFMLAYGSARLGENASQNADPNLLSQVIGSNSKELLKEATALPKIVLGGPDLLTPAPPPLPWRKWLLWGILVVGVGCIAKMALSLGKGMSKEK
jgi:hypothetical protein